MLRPIPNILSIAGSDPSGGAGIQADLKTFAAFRCHGMAVIAALTAQNTQGVSAVHLPPPEFVGRQIKAIFDDIDVAAVKIGMLGSPEIVEAVAEALHPHAGLPIVLDPVLASTSGADLGARGTVDTLRDALIPLVRLVTPNLAEAGKLAEREPPGGRAEQQEIATRLYEGKSAWLIKGGHGDGDTSDDLLIDDQGTHWFSAKRIATRNSHGTGCTLSSAIAALLGRGLALPEAVRQAKDYLGQALRGADALDVGHGHGPLDHFWGWRE